MTCLGGCSSHETGYSPQSVGLAAPPAEAERKPCSLETICPSVPLPAGSEELDFSVRSNSAMSHVLESILQEQNNFSHCFYNKCQSAASFK